MPDAFEGGPVDGRTVPLRDRHRRGVHELLGRQPDHTPASIVVADHETTGRSDDGVTAWRRLWAEDAWQESTES